MQVIVANCFICSNSSVHSFFVKSIEGNLSCVSHSLRIRAFNDSPIKDRFMTVSRAVASKNFAMGEVKICAPNKKFFEKCLASDQKTQYLYYYYA